MATIGIFLQCPNSQKNSFPGNYLRKYSMWVQEHQRPHLKLIGDACFYIRLINCLNVGTPIDIQHQFLASNQSITQLHLLIIKSLQN